MHYEQCWPDNGAATGVSGDVEVCKVCDSTTNTYWDKVIKFEIDAAGVVTETLVRDWADTGRPCNPASIIPPDVEWTRMCDVQADGTIVEFMLQAITNFDVNGLAIVPSLINNYELDKTTAYTLTGTLGDCGTDCAQELPLGFITDLALLQEST